MALGDSVSNEYLRIKSTSSGPARRRRNFPRFVKLVSGRKATGKERVGNRESDRTIVVVAARRARPFNDRGGRVCLLTRNVSVFFFFFFLSRRHPS